jgi:hypothetical protein
MTISSNVLAASMLLGVAPLTLAQSVGSVELDAVRDLLGLDQVALVSVELGGVPGQDATAWVEIDGEQRLMVLRPTSVLADGFQLIEHLGGDEYRQVEPAPVLTYRGEILDLPGIQVAASWLDDGLHARLYHEDGTSEWLEPLAGRVAGAGIGTYAFYSSEHVRDSGRTCGVTDAQRVGSTPFVQPGQLGQMTVGSPVLKICELGVDTDFEYYQDYGQSSQNVQNQINSVINSMNVQYETEVGIRHDITTIIVRTSSNDPYTTNDPSSFLSQFRSHWQSQQGSIPRDVAHLFTGKNLNGGVIGIAYLSAICSSLGYGLVESDCCGSFASKTDLSAHELGHNWAADHCSCSSPAYTMNPFITAANRFSPTQTIPAMINYAANRPCLDDETGAGPDPVINGVSPFFITAVMPDSPAKITLTGTGFSGVDAVTVDGVPLNSFPPEFIVASDTELIVTLVPPYDVGTKTIAVSEGATTVSINLPVFFNSEPKIDLLNSDPGFLITALGLDVYMGGPAGDLHLLLVSNSPVPSSLPGYFDVQLGNNLSALFGLGAYAVDSTTGYAQVSIPVSGLSTGTKLYFQSVVLSASNPVLPLSASNLEVGTVLF